MADILIPLPDLEATAELGAALADIVEPGDFVALQGPLGAGKTTLARALIEALNDGEPIEVTSPTYTLLQTYEVDGLEVWHADLYRLEEPEEALALGLGGANEAAFDAVQLVEWPERLGGYLPRHRLDIVLSVGPEGRTARLTGSAAWMKRLETVFE
jgi:tRNA threonylcarbamoyladenosine biosynthesis protein TsaE